jgi:hypothetical protein
MFGEDHNYMPPFDQTSIGQQETPEPDPKLSLRQGIMSELSGFYSELTTLGGKRWERWMHDLLHSDANLQSFFTDMVGVQAGQFPDPVAAVTFFAIERCLTPYTTGIHGEDVQYVYDLPKGTTLRYSCLLGTDGRKIVSLYKESESKPPRRLAYLHDPSAISSQKYIRIPTEAYHPFVEDFRRVEGITDEEEVVRVAMHSKADDFANEQVGPMSDFPFDKFPPLPPLGAASDMNPTYRPPEQLPEKSTYYGRYPFFREKDPFLVRTIFGFDAMREATYGANKAISVLQVMKEGFARARGEFPIEAYNELLEAAEENKYIDGKGDFISADVLDHDAIGIPVKVTVRFIQNNQTGLGLFVFGVMREGRFNGYVFTYDGQKQFFDGTGYVIMTEKDTGCIDVLGSAETIRLHGEMSKFCGHDFSRSPQDQALLWQIITGVYSVPQQ